MNQRAASGHEIWLFDLTHNNLTDDEILKGFIKYYVLCGCTKDNVIDDVIFKAHYDPTGIKEKLTEILEKCSKEICMKDRGQGLQLRDILEKLRRADKITIEDGPETLFIGNANQCIFYKELADREIDSLYPELLGGLIVNLKKQENNVCGMIRI